jgi:Holliday junction resolvase RusA-like endonuclease
MIDVELTIPPSANRIWRTAKNVVVKSDDYKRWINTVGWELQILKSAGKVRAIIGTYMLLLAVPQAMRGDIDNRHKALNDALERFGIVPDDKHCSAILVLRSADLPSDRCRVVLAHQSEILNFEQPHPLILAARGDPTQPLAIAGGGPTPLPLHPPAARAEAAL